MKPDLQDGQVTASAVAPGAMADKTEDWLLMPGNREIKAEATASFPS